MIKLMHAKARNAKAKMRQSAEAGGSSGMDEQEALKYYEAATDFYLSEYLKKKWTLHIKNWDAKFDLKKHCEDSFAKVEKYDRPCLEAFKELDQKLKKFMDDRNLVRIKDDDIADAKKAITDGANTSTKDTVSDSRARAGR
jgi:hypothetical protein